MRALVCMVSNMWLSSSENLLNHKCKHYKVRLSKGSKREFYCIVLQGPQRSCFSRHEIRGFGTSSNAHPVCVCTHW